MVKPWLQRQPGGAREANMQGRDWSWHKMPTPEMKNKNWAGDLQNFRCTPHQAPISQFIPSNSSEDSQGTEGIDKLIKAEIVNAMTTLHTTHQTEKRLNMVAAPIWYLDSEVGVGINGRQRIRRGGDHIRDWSKAQPCLFVFLWYHTYIQYYIYVPRFGSQGDGLSSSNLVCCLEANATRDRLCNN